jgi:hypothetical protein
MPYIGNPIYQSAFVTDQFSGTGSQTAYTMSVAPAGVTNVLVVVSGVVQDPSTYGVVGNTLTFSTAPPSGTGNISCRYLGVPVTGVTTTAYRTVTEFTATASQTTFTPPSYSVGFINVYLNGVLLGSADYTASNGTTVVLTTGAAAGNLVTVESFSISSVANAIPNAAGAVSSSNIFDGAVTPAKLSTGGPYWNTSSNVGIGTTSPAEKLHVSSGAIRISNTSNSLLEFNTNAGNRFGYLFGTSSSVQLAAESTANNVLSFSTAGAERMNISAAGQITMPYQPSFHVRVNNGAYLTTSPVPFSNDVFNVGSNFNTSTYRFTAPIAGKYAFMLNGYFRIATGNGNSVFQFRVNGSNRQYTEFTVPTATAYVSPCMTAIFNLGVGDYVDVTFSGSQTYYGGNSEMNFFGYLIG